MAESDLNYVKTILRSILTSSPANMTIAQVLTDYINLEGNSIPYIELGFKTVFELLETMKDLLQIPYCPNMNSSIKLITNEKTSHLRELVINQKSKKCKYNLASKRHKSKSNGTYNKRDMNKKTNACGYDNNIPDSIARGCKINSRTFHYNARGYDYIKKISNSSQKGFVTEELKKHVENLCNSSQFQSISVRVLKEHLIHHPDYKKLNTINIEGAISMLKFFIYIDKGGVHLKESPNEIFSLKNSYVKGEKPIYASCLQNIIVEDEEMSYSDCTMEDNNDYNLIQEFITEQSNVNVCDNFEIEQKKTDSSNIIKSNCDTYEVQQKNINLCTSRVFAVKPLCNNIKSIELKNGQKRKSIIKSSEKDGIDYISLIISIIENSEIPITVKKVLEDFEIIHGHRFPFQKYSCRSYMDFFRLYPSIFILDDQYSTNSIIRINIESMEDTPKRNFIFRTGVTEASIFKNPDFSDNQEEFDQVFNYISKFNVDNNYPQEHSEETPQSENVLSSYESYEEFDSPKILNTMKIKMRSLLNKYANGILCNEFMDIYADEYQSRFSFSDYGFQSMSDMAFKLPSVFYLEMSEEAEQYILYNACRRFELENQNNLNDPSLFYKNIPKTVLNNLSIFFDKYRTGIKIEELMKLYCKEFGRSYEPLKYGYSSEIHMFESLDKMVKIHNNVLYSFDPFAYRYFVENNDSVDMIDKTLPALPVDYLLNYSGTDVCNGKFQYTELHLTNHKLVDVIVAEIYTLNMFYVNLSSNVNMLNRMMDDLQTFYELNESKYQVNPRLLIPGLVCTSRFENTMKWHRAKILKIVNLLDVEVLYVDYGSIEIIPKTEIRLLHQKFGYIPVQGILCSLFDDDFDCIYPLTVNKMFASLVDDNDLEAKFKPLSSEVNSKKWIVTLFLKTEKGRSNLNKKCALAIKCNKNQGSVRRKITKLFI